MIYLQDTKDLVFKKFKRLSVGFSWSGLFVIAYLVSIGPVFAQVTFLDHRNKQIQFETLPERVVTIVRSAPILYYAIDGSEKNIAGMNYDSLSRYFTKGIYAEILPKLGKIDATAAREGFVPNVESILNMKPDAIIQWIYNPDIIEPLERVGLKVVGWDCCTKEHRLDYLRLSGYMTGRIDRAQALVLLQETSDAALRQKWAEVPKEKFVPILVVDQLNDQIRVVANGSDDFSLSGANNLAADNTGEWWRTIDAEQFFAWNPEVIVIPSYATGLNPSDFYNNQLLGSIKAIQNKRVYKVPQFTRTPDAPEIFLAAVWTARVLHGDSIAPDFRKRLLDAYQQIYSVTLSEQQIDAILEIEANAASANYQTLFK